VRQERLVYESSRNRLLRELYVDRWPALEAIRISGHAVSAPYLAWAHPDYEQAGVRLVVVGKETNGWGGADLTGLTPGDAVDTLMGEYRRFALGSHYRGRVSFWTPVHELYRMLNPDGPALGFVALNASVVDEDGQTPEIGLAEAITRTRLLPEAIRILEPTVVVFHTGPQYESWLDLWFPGLERDGGNELARLSAGGLPPLTFRTYHPRYLNYRSRRSAVYGEIVDAALHGA
jgi:hypothetical protein